MDQTTVRLKLFRLPLVGPAAWSEMHGAPMRRWHLDEAVRQVGGMLITDSRGIFDALTRSESPQLRLRSSRTGEESTRHQGTMRCLQCSYSLGQHFDDVGRQSDQAWISRSCGDGIVLVKKLWKCTFDPTFESANVGKQEAHPCSMMMR